MQNATNISVARWQHRYGKSPRGLGMWYFSWNHPVNGPTEIGPGKPMTYADACVWVRAMLGATTPVELLP